MYVWRSVGGLDVTREAHIQLGEAPPPLPKGMRRTLHSLAVAVSSFFNGCPPPVSRGKELPGPGSCPSEHGDPRRRGRGGVCQGPHGPPAARGPRAELHPPRDGLRKLHRPEPPTLRGAEPGLPSASRPPQHRSSFPAYPPFVLTPPPVAPSSI